MAVVQFSWPGLARADFGTQRCAAASAQNVDVSKQKLQVIVVPEQGQRAGAEAALNDAVGKRNAAIAERVTDEPLRLLPEAPVSCPEPAELPRAAGERLTRRGGCSLVDACFKHCARCAPRR